MVWLGLLVWPGSGYHIASLYYFLFRDIVCDLLKCLSSLNTLEKITNLLQNSTKLHIHESGVAYSTYVWNYHNQTVPINQETNKAKGAFVKVSLGMQFLYSRNSVKHMHLSFANT